MMYKSPIEIMQTEMRVQMENGIMKAVQDVGINVDKDELLKALAYDREQYQKGFADGKVVGHEWISVHDALPGMDENVLFHPMCNEKSIYIGQFSYVGKSGAAYFAVRSGKRKVTYSATHWMPLPEPPIEDEHGT